MALTKQQSQVIDAAITLTAVWYANDRRYRKAVTRALDSLASIVFEAEQSKDEATK